jgi:hypothetical protein
MVCHKKLTNVSSDLLQPGKKINFFSLSVYSLSYQNDGNIFGGCKFFESIFNNSWSYSLILKNKPVLLSTIKKFAWSLT